MDDRGPGDAGAERRADEAAGWVLRQDRGLTAAEQDAFSQWLARDSRHGAELARFRRHWQRLDPLADWRPEHSARPNPDLLAPKAAPVRRSPGWWLIGLAAAATVALMLWREGPGREAGRTPAAVAAAPAEPVATRRVLEDGTVVELNRGAMLTEHFTAAERRVRLTAGEAHFTVTKDSARPFVVAARGMDVRAVGTAFNVRLAAAAVEVLVTEGRVQVDDVRPAAAEPETRAAAVVPLLEAGQRAVVSLAPQPEPVRIALLTAGEIERVLAWQHRLLEFNAAPLADVVAEFNRRNAVQLVVADPELAAVRITTSFQSDNIDGFVRLLELGFGARAERRGEGEIVLRKAR
jgi:transmembrane sensor